MSTTLTERPAAPAAPPPPRGGTRFQRWLASWRVSLKMARRDALRYKGRSALVIVMVALPVAMIVGGLAFAATTMRSLEERLPWMLGSSQAVIQSISTDKVNQGVDGQSQWGYDETLSEAERKAKPIPGFTEGGTVAERTAALSAIIPGTIVPVQAGDFRWVNGQRQPRGTAIYLDPTVDLGEKLRLTSGRWPTSKAEIVVTPAGIDHGMPSSGMVEVKAGSSSSTVTIVGVANVFDADIGMPDVLTTEPFADDLSTLWSTTWLIQRSEPVTWSEVRKLNEYGLAITSRDPILNPPLPSELPGVGWDQEAAFDQETKLMAAIFGAVLFLVTALLVGPAFAVSAGRQRRSLALAASNGAEVRQLRRSVLGSALVLGVLAALTGAVVGPLVVLAGVAVWHQMRPWSTLFGPLDVPILASVIVVVCAILAALTAALIPALRLGRLDIIGVMKGQNVSPRHSRLLPIIGAVLFGLGAVALFVAVSGNSSAAGVAGVFGLVTGSVCLIPLLLVIAGGLASRFPVAVRMATRDAARQRHRSAPTVAALMAGSALLATFAIGLESNSRFQASHYEPQTVAGEGQMYIDLAQREIIASQVAALAPTWRLVPQPNITAEWNGAEPPASEPWVSVVPPGCTIAAATPMLSFPNGEVPPSDPCQRISTSGYKTSNNHSEISVMPAAEITRRFQLQGQAAEAVAKGAALVADPAILTDGRLSVLIGTFRSDSATGNAQIIGTPKQVTIPAIVAPADAGSRGALPGHVGLVLSSEFTTEHDISTVQSEFHVYDTRGGITRADQKKVEETLSDSGVYVQVERGYERPDKWLMLGVMGIAGLLLVIVTLISTALALAEQQADMGTLAAVGATKGTRRRFAAAQAATVAVIGGVLGIAIGLVAGVAISYPTTTSYWDNAGNLHEVAPTIGIPLTPMAMILIAVPVLAALIAAASIRRAPSVTRRGN